jgi:elongation factor Ts
VKFQEVNKMKITAAEVNALRKTTGAGMMDCKKALVEAEGDNEKAIEILRKKGQKVAAKRGDNEASEGLAIAKSNGTAGVVVRLNCETDFVAKNDNYNTLVSKLAEIALATGSKSIDELKAQDYDGLTVETVITDQIGKIGEKLDLSAVHYISADAVVAYNHPGNQIATLVGLNQEGDNVADAGRDVAMQVAAMNPVALNKDSIPEDVIAKELEIGRDLAIQEGKPAEMADKIAQGRLGKFFKEATLLDQAYIKDNKMSVQKYLDSVSKGLTVTEYSRVAMS